MKAISKTVDKTSRDVHHHKMTIRKSIDQRSQYLYIITQSRAHISAARYRLTPARYSPWLITHGKEYLPQNPITRGKYLTKIFNEA